MNLSHFPHELLEIIAFYLSTHGQYIGLTVCQSWYLPFCRILYRHIVITHRQQLKKFLILNHHSQFIRTIQIGVNDHTFKTEDCVTGAIPLLPIQVGVTSHELQLLTQQLPKLVSIYFDPRLWHFINSNDIQLSHNIQKLPPLNHPKQLSLLNGLNSIKKLHVRGSDMFGLHQQDKFLAIFKSLSLLTELTIDGDGMWDTEHIMQFTTRDLDTLHSYLPFLKCLNIMDAIYLVQDHYHDGINAMPAQELEQFTLFASIEGVDIWCSYFSIKYPSLKDLSLKWTNNNTAIQYSTSFTRMLNKLNRLKSLKLHPSMCTQQYINDTTFDKLEICQLEFGVWQPNALNKLLKPDLYSSVTSLFIPSYSNTLDLSVLNNLCRLELKCCSQRTMLEEKLINTSTTTVSLDLILNTCPSLVDLEIKWGTVTYSTLVAGKKHQLKTLRLDHVSVENTNIFGYISMRCFQLEGLFLRECHGITEINMLNTQFKYIVLSELANQLKLIQFQKLEKQRKRRKFNLESSRYYTSYQDQYTYQTCIKRIPKEPKRYISLLCGSVDKLLFNGCKI